MKKENREEMQLHAGGAAASRGRAGAEQALRAAAWAEGRSEDQSGLRGGGCYTAGEDNGSVLRLKPWGRGLLGLGRGPREEGEEGRQEGKEPPDRQEPGQPAPHKGETPTAPAPQEAGVEGCGTAPATGTVRGRGKRGRGGSALQQPAWPSR